MKEECKGLVITLTVYSTVFKRLLGLLAYGQYDGCVLENAADEIERLRAELTDMTKNRDWTEAERVRWQTDYSRVSDELLAETRTAEEILAELYVMQNCTSSK